jgi:hypothetical protein
MHLSKTLAIIINGKDGKPEWREVSQKYLPKGGRTLNLPLVSFNLGIYSIYMYIRI